jgi:Dna[CI] antecedent DciA-like protein
VGRVLRGAEQRGEGVRGILTRELRVHGLSARLPKRIPPGVWESAVGKQIAARAQPTVLSFGILHVLVQDHRWRDQLDAARNFLVERLNGVLGNGTVRSLQFGLAHHGALDEARLRAGIGLREVKEAFIEPQRVLGEARLEPALREAVLRAAEAQARRRA